MNYPHLPPKYRRYVKQTTLILALGVGVSAGLIDLYGTYTAFNIPTPIETFGFLLVILLWYVIAFVMVILPNIDDFTIENPFADIPLTIPYLGLAALLLGIDATLFESQTFSWITTAATDNQALISLFLSGLLVLLYFDQHRTQRQQVEIMDKQAGLEERRISWREEQDRPRLQIETWQFHEGDEPVLTDTESDVSVDLLASYLMDGAPQDRVGIFMGDVSNQGGTTAQSLRLRIEVLVRSDELPNGYLHLNGSFVYVRTNLVRLDRSIHDQYLKRSTVSIDPGDTVNVLGGTMMYPIAGAEQPIDDLGELLHQLPFSVEDVALRASLIYEGPIETEHTEPIAAVRLSPDEINDLASAFMVEQQVGFHGIPTFGAKESIDLIEEEFADITPSEYGYDVSYTYEGS